jgi:hypothetical protein
LALLLEEAEEKVAGEESQDQEVHQRSHLPAPEED